MTKHLLAGVAALELMSGVAFAQTYIPTSPPAAAVGVPGSTTMSSGRKAPAFAGVSDPATAFMT